MESLVFVRFHSSRSQGWIQYYEWVIYGLFLGIFTCIAWLTRYNRHLLRQFTRSGTNFYMARQPDIILLVLDTQRADHLSCYGYERQTSPALDVLAADAWRFSAAMAPAQWTVPTHASLFTGLYPSQHTMHQMNSVLPASLATLAQRLSQAGYFTAGFSQNPLIGLVKNDLDRGFAHFESHHLLSNILLTTRLNQPATPPSLRKRAERGVRWLLAEALGYSNETPLQRLTPLLAPLWQRLLHAQGRSKIGGTRRLLEEASRLLTERERAQPGQPIFLFINLMGAHVPYDPDRRLLRQFLPAEQDTRQTNALLRWANGLQIDVHNWINEPLPPSRRALLEAIYDAEVATQDAHVGAFLQRLRAASRYDNTVIAVVADHGDHLGDKDRVNHAFGVYEALVHVPLIIRHPQWRAEAGSVCTQPVSTRRVFHTLLAAAGNATPEEAKLSLDNEGAHDTTVAVISEGFPLEWALGRLQGEKARYARENGHTRTVRAVREGRYKLISGAGWQELYDVEADGAEEHNLQATLPEKADALQKPLQAFMDWAAPVAGAQTREEVDPQVLQQLRDLGYLE